VGGDVVGGDVVGGDVVGGDVVGGDVVVADVATRLHRSIAQIDDATAKKCVILN
jgi:hypothetical protein